MPDSAIASEPIEVPKTEDQRLKPGDEGWTDYVMSLFTKDELADGKFPTCDGLRRVFEIVMGTIVESQSKVIAAPSSGDNIRATVEYTLRYRPHRSDLCSSSMPYRVFTDAAHVGPENTALPFSQYPVATASTMAEGRVLRKAMRLIKVLTKEEVKMQADEETAGIVMKQKAEDLQLKFIKIRSEKLNIDLAKLVQKVINRKVDVNAPLDTVSYVEAQDIILLLNDYDRGPDNKGGKVVPTDIIREVNNEVQG